MSNVVREEYIQINLWCRPLGRTVYSFGSIKKGKVKNVGTGTGTLLAEIERREKEASGILLGKKAAENISSGEKLSLDPEQLEIAEARARLEGRGAAQEDVPRFKRLKARIDSRVFDYSEIEREKIEEEIDRLVNKDGYYNEIEPVDADDSFTETGSFNPVIIGLFAALFITLGLLIFFIKNIM